MMADDLSIDEIERRLRARFGGLLRAHRERLGYTQWDVCRMIGGRQSRLSRIEVGQSLPSLAYAARICDVLGLSLLELIREAIASPVEARSDHDGSQ